MTRRAARSLRGGLLAAAAALVAGCAAAPQVVPGNPAPLTPVPATPTRSSAPPAGSSAPAGTTPSSPTASRPAPALPAAYGTFELDGQGVTVALPVPTGWRRTPNTAGYDFVDPTGRLLLRLNLTAREPGTVRQSWERLEPPVDRKLTNYRRLDARDVPDFFDGALDWTFRYDDPTGEQQVVDRLLVAGPAGLAIYFRAPRADFGRLLPIWDKAVGGLAVS